MAVREAALLLGSKRGCSVGLFKKHFKNLVLIVDSDSEEDEPHFYSASEPRKKGQPEPQSDHSLSMLCLTVLIGKGRLQALTDCKVSRL